MSLQQLGKKLKKEFQRNPKKSAMLGLACLVAVYFWWPLIRKWTGSKPPPVAVAVAVAPATAPTAETGVGAGVSESPGAAGALLASASMPKWNDLMKMLSDDPLAGAAEFHESTRDPFASTKADVNPEEEERIRKREQRLETITAKAVEVSPAELGLVLSSTLVMKGSGRATINGRSYRVGSEIVLASKPVKKHREKQPQQSREGEKAGETSPALASGKKETETEAPIAFVLSEVGVDFVKLVRDGKDYELKLPRGNDLAGNRYSIIGDTILSE